MDLRGNVKYLFETARIFHRIFEFLNESLCMIKCIKDSFYILIVIHFKQGRIAYVEIYFFIGEVNEG